jgi:F0F1-type ATP synthase assembly protein I
MLDDKKRNELRQDFEASAVGWMFPIAMGLGFGIGYGLDKVFHTWPWLTATFSAFGIIAAFINLFRLGTGKNGS